MERFPATFSPASPRDGCGHHSRSGRDSVGTRFGLSGLIRLALLAALGIVVLTGCATMTAYNPEVAAYQALADQATEHFHKGHVSISLDDSTKGLYYLNSIKLGVRNGYNHSLPLLAHELGHHILNHGNNAIGSAQEMDANAMGVEVLQVWGWSFYQAFDMRGDMLCRARGANTPGHLSRAEEIVDLKARYAPRADGFHCWNENAMTAPVLLAQFGSLP